MRFGLNVPGVYLYPGTLHPWEPQATVEDILRVVRKADELGYSFLGVPEHLIMGEKMMPAMGARWPHCVTAIAFFGGATRQIRLANSICVIPYHNPIELAKMYSTLDYLSGGRLIVGVGIGGTAEHCMSLAKKSLLGKGGEPNPDPETAQFEAELLEAVNATGIGPQAVGGRTTALAVNVEVFPTHIASLPVAVNLQCHSARTKQVVL